MIFVDDAGIPAQVVNRHIPGREVVHDSTWSHLISDAPSDEELHAFARRLGLRPEYFQHPGQWHRHYDVTTNKRYQAICLGAREVTQREAVGILRIRDADQRAGKFWKAGHLLGAAEVIQEARTKYPEHEDLWSARIDALCAAMRRVNEIGRRSCQQLPGIIAKREERHGIAPDDPGRQQVISWNSAAILRDAPNIAEHLNAAERMQAQGQLDLGEAGQ